MDSFERRTDCAKITTGTRCLVKIALMNKQYPLYQPSEGL